MHSSLCVCNSNNIMHVSSPYQDLIDFAPASTFWDTSNPERVYIIRSPPVNFLDILAQHAQLACTQKQAFYWILLHCV